MVSNEIQAIARGEKRTAQKRNSTTSSTHVKHGKVHALSMAEAIWQRKKKGVGETTFYQPDADDKIPNVRQFGISHLKG